MAEKNQNPNAGQTGASAADFYSVDYGLDGDITLTDIQPLPGFYGEETKNGKPPKRSKKDKSAKGAKSGVAEDDGLQTSDPQAYADTEYSGGNTAAAGTDGDFAEAEDAGGNKKSGVRNKTKNTEKDDAKKKNKNKKRKAEKRPVPKIKWQKDLSFAGIFLNKIKTAHLSVVVSLDMQTKMINIMDIKGKNGKTAHVTRVPFKENPEDAKFFDYLSASLAEFSKSMPQVKSINHYVVLPDACAALDIITIPAISKKRVQESLEINISETYRDINALRMSCSTIGSNNKMVTYTLTSIRKKLLDNYKKALERVKMPPKVFTYSGAATLNSVFALQSRNRGRSFIFMDVKKTSTRFVICARGRLVGFFNHPIGYEILTPDKIVNESTLYNHDIAELAVLNAEEKAKRKELTLLDIDAEEDSESFLDQVIGNGGGAPAEAPTQADNKKTPKLMVKKTARKLPKFMQRPEPETPEGRVAENFRILQKWALLLARANRGIGRGCDPEYILVNLPPQFASVIEAVNREKKENGIEFRRFNTDHFSSKVCANLELYGAVYADTYNLQHNF